MRAIWRDTAREGVGKIDRAPATDSVLRIWRYIRDVKRSKRRRQDRRPAEADRAVPRDTMHSERRQRSTARGYCRHGPPAGTHRLPRNVGVALLRARKRLPPANTRWRRRARRALLPAVSKNLLLAMRAVARWHGCSQLPPDYGIRGRSVMCEWSGFAGDRIWSLCGVDPLRCLAENCS